MAGRIPDVFIQDLLSRTDIVEVIGSRLELKRAGREYKALSPFSNEKSPSFFVSPAKQMFFDFSSGRNGTAISFLMEFDRLSFVEAVEELAKRAGLTVPREGGRGGEQLVLEGPLDALAAAERFFRTQLRTHQPAIDYLKKRGLSGDTAKLYGIGYAPDSWDALAQHFPDPTHALTAGLLKKKEETGRVFDVFRNRIMFPIRDTRGRVIAFGGRTLANDPAKYLNSPETPLFHKGRNLFGLYEAKQSSKSELPFLLVVEGYMDVVMLAQHGIRNVVATLGTATTREHLALLFKSAARVVFCFDGDRAGRSAAWRALEQALPEVYEGRECRFMFLPEGHDPDTLVQEIGADEFRSRVDQAMTLSDFLLGELAKQVNLGTIDGRARLAGLARPHLERMREGPLRALIANELGRLTRLNGEQLEAMLSGRQRPEDAARPAPQSRPEMPGARSIKRALQLLLERPEMAQKVEHVEQLAASGQPGMDILMEAVEFFREHPHCHAGQLLEQWRDTPKGAALNRILGIEAELDEAAVEHEFADAMDLLRRRALRDRMQALADASRSRTLTSSETAEWLQIEHQLSGARLV
ncbi:MAG: DNA primase [Nevskia sp.]|nr:DNA primase [Nevskia sp.]